MRLPTNLRVSMWRKCLAGGYLDRRSVQVYSPASGPGHTGVMKLLGEAACRNGRSIPSFLIRNINVVRFKPRITAAPFGPPILQPVASSVWSMSARSESRSVLGTTGSGSLDVVAIGRRRGDSYYLLRQWVWKHTVLGKNYGTLHQIL